LRLNVHLSNDFFMSNFPPQRIEEARNFCCCSPYRNRQICIYAGGGSRTQHDMHWGYIIYDADGDRISYENLQNCLDVDDGLRFCEALIDRWDAPITYEDVRLWRDICEYLNQRKAPTSSHYIELRIPGCDYLVGYDRTHRQKLWDKFKIQLITYEKFSRNHEGWKLKGNWDTLPRPWLEKWQRKQQAKKYQELADALSAVERRLDTIHSCDEWTQAGIINYLTDNPDMLKSQLEHLSYLCKEARGLLSELLKNEPK
jgi:hypothetical protein